MYRLRGRLRLTAAVAAAALGAATAGTTVAGAAGASSSAPLPQITVNMDRHHLTVGGTLVSGAATVKATVSGEPEGDFAFIHLNPGVSYAQFAHFVSTHQINDPNEVSAVGAILFDYAAPRGTSEVQTQLPAGKYVAIDTGGESGPTSGAHDMFQIARAKHPASLPAPAATVRSIEFGFRGADTLQQGSLVRFENSGYLVHMIVAAQARNDSDAQKLAAALHRGDDNAAQKLAIGFASFLDPVSHGGVIQRRLDVAKGSWVIACFIDTQDGREHTRLGMTKLVHVN